jgi:uncharacterized protein (DUF58 family)
MRKGDLPSPTPHFFALLFVLGAIWYAASSQNNSAVYLLFFALVSVFLVSLTHTLLNLGGLKATAESVKPTFAGQEILVPLEVANASRASRHAIAVSLPGFANTAETIHTIDPGKAERIALRFSAPARGEYAIEMVCLTTVYPLGFFRARKCVSTKQKYLVYPKPAGDLNLPITLSRSAQNRPGLELGGGDDFAGVRPYVPGESQRHIDWKAVARGQALMTKQFAAESPGALYLDLSQLRFSSLDEKLSQLALWVIEAERARKPYGLRLRGALIPPSLGDSHFHRCLRALALYQ